MKRDPPLLCPPQDAIRKVRFGCVRIRYKESREVTLSNGRKRISQIAAGLNLQSMIDAAHRVFGLAVNKNFTQGRRATHVCAACLYVACRFNKNPTMLIDFADLLQTDVYVCVRFINSFVDGVWVQCT